MSDQTTKRKGNSALRRASTGRISLALWLVLSAAMPGICADEIHDDKPLSGSVSNVQRRHWTRGPLLLSPTEHDSIVETPFGEVGTAINSLSLIVVTDESLLVYDLHDGKRNAVVVRHGKETVDLLPGGVVSITKYGGDSFKAINPAALVAYRRMRNRSLENGMKLFQGDFDLASMLSSQPRINDLRKSPDPRVRKIMDNMLKTVVIMNQISRSDEPFKQYL